jgi:Ca2+-binding RTX toxin-like protein
VNSQALTKCKVWLGMGAATIASLVAAGIPLSAKADVANPQGATFSATVGQPFDGVVGHFSSSFSDLPNFSATIDWGDGSPPTAGRISNCAACPDFGYDVTGGHTYTTPLSFSVTITIQSARDMTSGAATGAAKVFAKPVTAARPSIKKKKVLCGSRLPGAFRRYRGVKYKLVLGTNKGDHLHGTRGPVLVVGLGGPDHISGGHKQDIICGDAGGDVISGGNGNDLIFGGSGGDEIYGDLLETGAFDSCFLLPVCLEPHTWDYLGVGHDLVFGGPGNDFIAGGTGDNLLYGDADDDYIIGSWHSQFQTPYIANPNAFYPLIKFNDYLSGGSGNDRLDGSLNYDSVNGGVGSNDQCREDSSFNEDIQECEQFEFKYPWP